MKKVIYAILICIIVAGAIIIGTLGLKADIIYSKNAQIDVYIGKEVNVKDIQAITKEVFPNDRVIIQKVELFNDMVSIIIPEKSDEELSESYMNSQGDYLSIFYGEKNYIINLATKQVEIEIPDQHYCIDSIKDNDMIVYACGPIDSEYSSEYKWIKRDSKLFLSYVKFFYTSEI